jgi:uncharacterized membrane protein YecN with MAPEG domain
MSYFFVCAGLLGALFILLSANVVRHRQRARVSLGSGNDKALETAIRAHGNFAEYVPLALILIMLAGDYYGFRTVAALSVGLLLGRIAHAGGLLLGIHMGRVVGVILTAAVIAACVVLIVPAGMGYVWYGSGHR